jgi:hypothetical protein
MELILFNNPFHLSGFMVPNALQAAAVRVLADFILAFRFHFISHYYFPYRQTPHCSAACSLAAGQLFF